MNSFGLIKLETDPACWGFFFGFFFLFWVQCFLQFIANWQVSKISSTEHHLMLLQPKGDGQPVVQEDEHNEFSPEEIMQ